MDAGIGPILGGIIGLAATSGGWKSGLVLSSFYAAGLALPFLLTGLGINQFLQFLCQVSPALAQSRSPYQASCSFSSAAR